MMNGIFPYNMEIYFKDSDDKYKKLGTCNSIELTCSRDGYCAYDLSVTRDYERYVNGIWNNNDDSVDATRYYSENKIKERNDNMNILELYGKRKREEINNKYKELVGKEYNELDVVKEYKELINTFDINMKQLADKYNNNDTQPLVKTAYRNDYSYELSMYLEEEIISKYNTDKEKEFKELDRLLEEVASILSLSDDKDYQLEVLKNYDIIDKKGKLNI